MAWSRRQFTITCASSVVLGADALTAAEPELAPPPTPGPVEPPFVRDYPKPSFTPSWRRSPLPRLLVQDFVIFAHSDLPMVQRLLTRQPALVNATIDWGGGDWESALGAASHMGRRDIAEYLLAHGARIDIFCATMMGLIDVVKTFLTLQPALIDAKGPHGFTLHFHAQLADDGGKILDFLQSIKKVDLPPNPFRKK